MDGEISTCVYWKKTFEWNFKGDKIASGSRNVSTLQDAQANAWMNF